MSITFHPDSDPRKINPENIVYEGMIHIFASRLPEEMIQQDPELYDLDYKIWEMQQQQGPMPLQFWQSLAQKHQMQPQEDYPWHKSWVYKNPQGEVGMVLSLSGSDVTHRGKEVNLSNASARTILNALGLPDDDSGRINPVQLNKLIQEFMSQTQNPQTDPSVFYTRPATDEQAQAPLGLGPAGPRMIDMGYSKSQLTNTMLRLEQLADHCMQHEVDVVWA